MLLSEEAAGGTESCCSCLGTELPNVREQLWLQAGQLVFCAACGNNFHSDCVLPSLGEGEVVGSTAGAAQRRSVLTPRYSTMAAGVLERDVTAVLPTMSAPQLFRQASAETTTDCHSNGYSVFVRRSLFSIKLVRSILSIFTTHQGLCISCGVRNALRRDRQDQHGPKRPRAAQAET